LQENRISAVVEAAVATFFPANPPTFFHVPFGYHDREAIRAVMQQVGFAGIRLEEVPLPGTSRSARDAATGVIEGCRLIVAIQERGVTDPGPIVAAAAKTVAAEFGDSPVRFGMKALWVAGTKP